MISLLVTPQVTNRVVVQKVAILAYIPPNFSVIQAYHLSSFQNLEGERNKLFVKQSKIIRLRFQELTSCAVHETLRIPTMTAACRFFENERDPQTSNIAEASTQSWHMSHRS